MTAKAQLKPDHSNGELELVGQKLIADVNGCLYWPSERLLVVSDLHLEKGSSFAARRSVFVPPYDSHATLDRLSESVNNWQPRTVISLGDSFHDDEAASRLPQDAKHQLDGIMHDRQWVWISGNHDPLPPSKLGGMHCHELQIGPLNFRHEPRVDCLDGEVAGHLHPSAKLRKRGKTIRKRCFASDGNRLIMPAFGAFTGGLDIHDEAFKGMFNATSLIAWMMGNGAVHAISSKQLVRG